MTTDNNKTAQQIVSTLITTFEGFERVWRYQLLNNTDQLKASLKEELRKVSNGNSVQNVDLLIANLIRDPFCRQMGRLKCSRRTLEELNRLLEK